MSTRRFEASVLLLLVVAAHKALSSDDTPPGGTQAPPGTNETLLWGSYTAQLLMGMSARHPASPRFGVAWSRPEPSRLRYKSLESIGVDSSTWHVHDGSAYGAQDLVDTENGVTVKGAWVKTGTREWAYRVSAEPFGGRTPSPTRPRTLAVTLFWADYHGAKPLRVIGAGRGKGATGRVVIKGVSGVPEIGGYSVVFGAGTSSKHKHAAAVVEYPSEYAALQPDTSRAHCLGIRMPKSDDDLGESLISALQLNLVNQAMNVRSLAEAQSIAQPPVPDFVVPVLPDESSKSPNAFFVQRILKVPFSIDVAFIQSDLHQPFSTDDDEQQEDEKVQKSSEYLETSVVDAVAKKMMGAALTARLEQAAASFEHRVLEMFPTLTQLPEQDVVNERFTLSQIERFWAKNALANVMGGLSYFAGDKYTDEEEMAFADEQQQRTLFTTLESKSEHQYGSLFEAGLAQVLVAKWNIAIMKEVLGSWFANQDPDTGYLPSPQVYGSFAAAAAKKVGVDYGDVEYGTAPTFLFALTSYLEALKSQPDAGEPLDWITEMYPKLVAYYDWLKEHQQGPRPDTFAWTRLKNGQYPGSGMPTYPRGRGDGKEMHLDALCWMLFYAQHLQDLALFLGEDGTRFAQDHERYLDSLNRYHLDTNSKLYYDVVDIDDATDTVTHSGHFGLVSLFPLIVTHVRSDAVTLAATLRKLKNTLVTPHGLASLDKTDKAHVASSPWCGGVHIGMNFLVLNALKYFGTVGGPQRKLAQELFNTVRAGMLAAINNEYSQVACLYEWYDSKNGKGYGAHPTTGTTSLALFILAEQPYTDN